MLLAYMLRPVELGLGPDVRMQSVSDLSQPYCQHAFTRLFDAQKTSKPPGIRSSPRGPGWRFQSGADLLGSTTDPSTAQTSRESRVHRV